LITEKKYGKEDLGGDCGFDPAFLADQAGSPDIRRRSIT
jgi:hypothetical protein